eukprot:COSAG04_NODE_201_length_20457_cov_316.186462_7_plen_88_part_00
MARLPRRRGRCKRRERESGAAPLSGCNSTRPCFPQLGAAYACPRASTHAVRTTIAVPTSSNLRNAVPSSDQAGPNRDKQPNQFSKPS